MFKSARAVAANTDLDSAQAFLFKQENLHLALLISASGDDSFNTVRQLALDLPAQYFSSGSIPEKLEKALTYLQSGLAMTEKLEITLSSWEDSEKTTILYLKSIGQQRVCLLRDNKISSLLESSSGQLISGYIEEGDRVMLVSQNLIEESEELIRSNLDNLEEELSERVVENPNSGAMAAIIIEYSVASNQYSDTTLIPDLSGETTTPESRLDSGQARMTEIRNKLFTLKNRLARDPRSKFTLIGLIGLIIVVGLVFKLKHPASSPQSPSPSSNLQPPVSNIYQVSDLTKYLDLSLIKGGFSSQKMSYSLGNILLLDQNQKTLVELNLEKKSNQILGGKDQLGDVSSFSLNGDFAFTYSKDKGIVRIDTKAQKSAIAVKPDSDWGEVKDLVGFGGNIYLMDNIKNQIWKYTPASLGYSDKINYFSTGVKADFGGAERMEIDSSVWILKSGGEIDRFTQGNPDDFSPGGLDKNLKDVNQFFVSDETDNIYLIDGPNNRLVVLKKNGEYVAQYISDKFKDVSDLVVDETGKKVYLLIGNSIYTLDLH